MGVVLYNKCRIRTEVCDKIFLKDGAPENEVNFYDYDGFRLYSFTKSEFLNLTELPELPDRTSENLTCDGWNWTLQQIQSRLTSLGGDVNVGAVYHTTDGKTHITCKPTESYPQAQINLTPTVANAVTVDWGDGTTDTWTSTSAATKSHTYTGVTDSSEFDITILCSSGTYSFSTYFCGNNTNNHYCTYTDIKLSNKVTSIGNNCFINTKLLETITIPNSVTSLGYGCLYSQVLQHVTIPSEITSLGNYDTFRQCYNLKSIAIPYSVTSIGTYCFTNCYSLQSVTIPSGVTTIGSQCFAQCYSLQSVTIPSSVTSIGTYCFQSCYSLQSITIPSGVTSLGTYCFSNCSSLQKIYMERTTPPTLSSTNAIPSNANLVIYVPTGTRSTYQGASNWSSFSSKIFEYNY